MSLNDRFVVGLTGGIGSGKTTVSNWFATLGIDVIDADVIAHQIVQVGRPTLNLLVHTFGQWILHEDGTLNRQALRKHVFGSNSALKTLENITHPEIRREIERQLTNATSAYAILSAPLLLERPDTALKSLCDRIMVVDVSIETQLSRASTRDGQTVDEIRAIMSQQLPRQDRLAQADDIVDNNDSLETVYVQLQRLHQMYLQLAN